MSQLNYEDLIGTKVHDVELGTGTIEAIDHNSITYTPSESSGTLVLFNTNYIEYLGSDLSKIYYHKKNGSVHVYESSMMKHTEFDYKFIGEMSYYY